MVRKDAAGGKGTAGGADGTTIRPLGRPGDLGWVVMAHGELYAAEYGFNGEFEALVAKIVADYAAGPDPQREAAWIAEADGQRAGCVFLVAKDAETAQLRILLVDPAARGRHLGRRLVAECITFARQSGYRKITLWTQSILVAARKIYQDAGFRLVATEPHRSFGQSLIGETWEREL